MKSWNKCRKILCIRADNMGDVIMSGPAIRALKESFDCSITLLTSSMGSVIAPCLDYVDEVMSYNFPWIKAGNTLQAGDCLALIEQLKAKNFDAAVIFTVYSQSALPAATLCFMAGIPLRLAYSRENAYELLTHWVPDKEPFTHILHQVQRDLNLVRSVGAVASDDHLFIRISEQAKKSCAQKLDQAGIDLYQPYIIVHTGVSEAKREYPRDQWIDVIQLLKATYGIPVLLSGAGSERSQAEYIHAGAGDGVHNIAGELNIEEFAACIEQARLVISVNTATAHIAAATQTPVVVLYAMTNPQHTPWKVRSQVLYFSVQDQLRSRNEIINFVSNKLYAQPVSYPSPQEVVDAAAAIVSEWLTVQ